MSKKKDNTLLIVAGISILALGAWYLYTKSQSTPDKQQINDTNSTDTKTNTYAPNPLDKSFGKKIIFNVSGKYLM